MIYESILLQMNLGALAITTSVAHARFEKAVGTSYRLQVTLLIIILAIIFADSGCGCPFWEVIFSILLKLIGT